MPKRNGWRSLEAALEIGQSPLEDDETSGGKGEFDVLGKNGLESGLVRCACAVFSWRKACFFRLAPMLCEESVEDHAHMKGDYTNAQREVADAVVEDHAHMKGDYTQFLHSDGCTVVEDHAHMKGDYTGCFPSYDVKCVEDHAHMKGDYTASGMTKGASLSKTTPI